MAATRGLRQAYQDGPMPKATGFRDNRFHQTLRGWMAAPRAATFYVGSAADMLRKAQDFSRIGGSENPAAHYFGR
jgi:hypothetical protein